LTVPNETSTSGPYNGDGVTATWPYGFRVDDASELVLGRRAADGLETTIFRNQLSVVIATDSSGTVTYPLGTDRVQTGETILVKRQPAFEQLTDLRRQGGYFPDVVEYQFDKLTFQTLLLKELAGRTLRLPESLTGVVSPNLPAPEAGKAMVRNEAETALINGASGGGSTALAQPTFETLTELADGTEMAATLQSTIDVIGALAQIDGPKTIRVKSTSGSLHLASRLLLEHSRVTLDLSAARYTRGRYGEVFIQEANRGEAGGAVCQCLSEENVCVTAFPSPSRRGCIALCDLCRPAAARCA